MGECERQRGIPVQMPSKRMAERERQMFGLQKVFEIISFDSQKEMSGLHQVLETIVMDSCR